MHLTGLERFAASKERVSVCVAVAVPKIKQCHSYNDILGTFLFNVMHMLTCDNCTINVIVFGLNNSVSKIKIH